MDSWLSRWPTGRGVKHFALVTDAFSARAKSDVIVAANNNTCPCPDNSAYLHENSREALQIRIAGCTKGSSPCGSVPQITSRRVAYPRVGIIRYRTEP